jgi:tetratricopeptide (TPR) repeat protein
LSRREKETLVSEGDALFNSGQFSAARDKYQAALSGGPSRAETRRWRPLVGRTYEAEGNYQKALTVYQEAFDGDPKNVDRWIDLARLYDAVEIDDQAVRFYAEAHKKDPGRRDVALALAALYAQAGRLAEPKPWLSRRFEASRGIIRPRNCWRTLKNGPVIWRARRVDGKPRCPLRPSAEGYMKVGRLWARQEVFDMADAAFVRAGQAGDSGPEPLFERAVLAWRQGTDRSGPGLVGRSRKKSPWLFRNCPGPSSAPSGHLPPRGEGKQRFSLSSWERAG